MTEFPEKEFRIIHDVADKIMDDYVAAIDRNSSILTVVLDDPRFDQASIVAILAMRAVHQIIGFAYNQEMIACRGRYPRGLRDTVSRELEQIKSQKYYNSVKTQLEKLLHEHKHEGGTVAVRTQYQQD